MEMKTLYTRMNINNYYIAHSDKCSNKSPLSKPSNVEIFLASFSLRIDCNAIQDLPFNQVSIILQTNICYWQGPAAYLTPVSMEFCRFLEGTRERNMYFFLATVTEVEGMKLLFKVFLPLMLSWKLSEVEESFINKFSAVFDEK